MDLPELFEKAKNGDNDAFTEIYDLYFTPISKYIYYRTKSAEDTKDLTQTVFTKFYKNIDKYTVDGNPLKYFYTVARNSVIDWQRKKKPYYSDEMENNSDSSQRKKIEISFLSEKILKTLKLLPLAQQEAIVLKIMHGFTNKEIGEIIDKTEENVRQLQSRGIKKVRSYMNYKKKR